MLNRCATRSAVLFVSSATLVLTSCKTTPKNSEVRADTDFGQGDLVDLTTYSSDGSDCPEVSDKAFEEVVGARPDYQDQGKPYHLIPKAELVEVTDYMGNGYKKLNPPLRDMNLKRLARIEPLVKCLASGLNKMPAYAGSVTRAAKQLTLEEILSYKVGKVSIIRDFFSTTTLSADDNPFCGDVRYQINAKINGHDVSWLAAEPSAESEVLFTPGSEFRVETISIEDVDAKSRCYTESPRRTLITMSEVPTGTYANEHNGSEAREPVPPMTDEELTKILTQPESWVNFHAAAVDAFFNTHRKANSADDLGRIAKLFNDLCTAYQKDPTKPFVHFTGHSCILPSVTIGSPFIYRDMPLAAGSQLLFEDSGDIRVGTLGTPLTVQGWALAAGTTVSFRAGKLSSLKSSEPMPIPFQGQNLIASGEVALDTKGQISRITLDRSSPPYVYNGLSLTQAEFRKGVLEFGTATGTAIMNGIDFTFADAGLGRDMCCAVQFDQTGKVSNVSANAARSSDGSLVMNTAGSVTFDTDSQLRTITANAGFTYKSTAYNALRLRPNGQIYAAHPLNASGLRFPCLLSPGRTMVAYYNDQGEVVACDGLADDFTFAGQLYKKGTHFGVDANGTALPAGAPAVAWTKYLKDNNFQSL